MARVFDLDGRLVIADGACDRVDVSTMYGGGYAVISVWVPKTRSRLQTHGFCSVG
jgi:hypothetical protein